jgi:hypothetical protein
VLHLQFGCVNLPHKGARGTRKAAFRGVETHKPERPAAHAPGGYENRYTHHAPLLTHSCRQARGFCANRMEEAPVEVAAAPVRGRPPGRGGKLSAAASAAALAASASAFLIGVNEGTTAVGSHTRGSAAALTAPEVPEVEALSQEEAGPARTWAATAAPPLCTPRPRALGASACPCCPSPGSATRARGAWTWRARAPCARR